MKRYFTNVGCESAKNSMAEREQRALETMGPIHPQAPTNNKKVGQNANSWKTRACCTLFLQGHCQGYLKIHPKTDERRTMLTTNGHTHAILDNKRSGGRVDAQRKRMSLREKQPQNLNDNNFEEQFGTYQPWVGINKSHECTLPMKQKKPFLT